MVLRLFHEGGNCSSFDSERANGCAEGKVPPEKGRPKCGRPIPVTLGVLTVAFPGLAAFHKAALLGRLSCSGGIPIRLHTVVAVGAGFPAAIRPLISLSQAKTYKAPRSTASARRRSARSTI